MVLFSLILPAGIATSRDVAATSSITFQLDDAGVYRHIRLLDISFARTYETEIYFNRSTASIPSNVNFDGTIGTPMLPVGNARTSEIGALDELPNFFDLTVNVPVPTVRLRQTYSPQTTALAYNAISTPILEGTFRYMCRPTSLNIVNSVQYAWRGLAYYNMTPNELICTTVVPFSQVTFTVSMLDHKMRPLFLLPPIQLMVDVTASL